MPESPGVPRVDTMPSPPTKILDTILYLPYTTHVIEHFSNLKTDDPLKVTSQESQLRSDMQIPNIDTIDLETFKNAVSNII